MRITAEPRSDQWNADDFTGGPREFTIAGVKPGAAEQKYDIELVEGEGRVWRPPLTMLRVLIAAWGDDATAWKGRRVRLFCDPSVTFGKDAVGGIRIAALSHIDGPLTLSLTATRGRRKPYRVEPLPVEPVSVPNELPAITPEQVAATTDLNELRDMWTKATPDVQALIQARVEELKAVES